MALGSRIVWPVVVLVAGLALSYGLVTGKPEPKARPAVAGSAPLVQVVTAAPADIALSVTTQGTVRPRREVDIVSQVGGRIIEVSDHFSQGSFFLQNEHLVKVEDADYRFALVRARARVADAAQNVAIERGRVRQAAREWRDLGNDEANELFLRKPQLASAEATLRAAEADLGQAELDLQRTAIAAPFEGRISEKYVDLGQYITPGTPIARVYSTDVVEVRLPLTDRQVALLDLPLSYQDHSLTAPGASVVLSARFADQQWQWQGEIVRTDASIDIDSRVMYAVVEVREPFAKGPQSERPPLAIGLFVEAEITGRNIAQVSVLPRNALRNDGSVLVADAQDRLQVRAVRMLKSSLRQAWVEGLAEGERVVVSRLPMAIAGMSVTVAGSPAVALDPREPSL